MSTTNKIASHHFNASLDDLYGMLQFIREHALATGFKGSELSRIELAGEEALVNIISYGYPGASGDIEIACHASNPSGVTIILKDHGVPYNPLTRHPESDSIEEKALFRSADRISVNREGPDAVIFDEGIASCSFQGEKRGRCPLAGDRKLAEDLNKAEEKRLGGYGIFFILKVMDDVTYERRGDCNILRLTKFLA